MSIIINAWKGVGNVNNQVYGGSVLPSMSSMRTCLGVSQGEPKAVPALQVAKVVCGQEEPARGWKAEERTCMLSNKKKQTEYPAAREGVYAASKPPEPSLPVDIELIPVARFADDTETVDGRQYEFCVYHDRSCLFRGVAGDYFYRDYATAQSFAREALRSQGIKAEKGSADDLFVRYRGKGTFKR